METTTNPGTLIEPNILTHQLLQWTVTDCTCTTNDYHVYQRGVTISPISYATIPTNLVMKPTQLTWLQVMMKAQAIHRFEKCLKATATSCRLEGSTSREDLDQGTTVESSNYWVTANTNFWFQKVWILEIPLPLPHPLPMGPDPQIQPLPQGSPPVPGMPGLQLVHEGVLIQIEDTLEEEIQTSEGIRVQVQDMLGDVSNQDSKLLVTQQVQEGKMEVESMEKLVQLSEMELRENEVQLLDMESEQNIVQTLSKDQNIVKQIEDLTPSEKNKEKHDEEDKRSKFNPDAQRKPKEEEQKRLTFNPDLVVMITDEDLKRAKMSDHHEKLMEDKSQQFYDDLNIWYHLDNCYSIFRHGSTCILVNWEKCAMKEEKCTVTLP